MIADFQKEYQRYRHTGERSLAQMSDEALNHIPAPDGNSAAMIVRHIGGNLKSRFTDFLTSDGEKDWRNRDDEFRDGPFSRNEVDEIWRAGWSALEQALAGLTDESLERIVHIRGEALTVHAALCRSTTHVAYHVGQLVILAREAAEGSWQWISIPKGQSAEYNRGMKEKKG